MWNPFRKSQQSQQEMFNKMMEAVMQKAEEAERPYRNTRIGFGAKLDVSV